MGRGSSSEKLERLDQLLGKLKSGEFYTAAVLAAELGVSIRTLMRDLDTLKVKGYPVESEKGRGGGVRLYPRWGIGRLALNYREVIDLLLTLAILEKLDSPLFLNNLDSVRNKLYASFPDSQRPQIKSIRQRILIGKVASTSVLQNYNIVRRNEHTEKALESFFERKKLAIKYQRADGEFSERTIEIHYLFLNWPVWYIIAWDHLRAGSRTFRIDRLLGAKLERSVFQVKPITDFSKELLQFSRSL